MTTMRSEGALFARLIQGCSEGDESSWHAVWPRIAAAAQPPIRRAVRARRLDPGLAEDLGQEFYLHLSRHTARRLRAFRGGSEAEFRRFIGRVCRRFVASRLRRLAGAQAREAEARAAWGAAAGPYATPDEAELEARLAELRSGLPAADEAHLRTLLAGGGAVPSDRTRRRRTGRLYVHCAARLAGEMEGRF
jgi:DNA-directed RNA polymerase specialized sigma24 family protein